ncbi:MAG: hypothetical protein ACRD96_20415 [Bryobacteraceae bacterium]
MTLLIVALLSAAQVVHDRIDPPNRTGRLPNGKLQQEEILKLEHEKTVQDLAQLLKVAEALQDELLKNDRHVLSLSAIKKAEEVEKLAKRLRARLRK